MKLKIITQNLHCFAEENIEEKQKLLSDKIAPLDVDIVFLQEVAQSSCLPTHTLSNDNYGLKIQKLLKDKNLNYYFYRYYGELQFQIDQPFQKLHYPLMFKKRLEKWFYSVIQRKT